MNSLSTAARSLAVAGAVALLASAPLAAQKRASQPIDDRLAEQMKAEAGRLVADYWTPKLNDYKVRIDRTLSPTDLDELNRLRVRFSMLMGDKLEGLTERRSENSGGAGRQRLKVDGDEEMRKATDFMEIYSSTKELAARYQGDLHLLGQTVIDDVISFTDLMARESAQFINEHRNEMSPQQVNEYNEKVRAFSETVGELKTDREGQMGLAAIYTFAVEPIIMLYNGADLNELLQQVGGIAKPVAGLDIPQSGVLMQNFPNPAIARTTISYTLAEPSSRTTLRLYNAEGAVVKTLDLGSVPAGEQSAELDVSGLATGTYLYQLSIQTAGGEQVHARRMQVVR